jgi:predicted deacylase
VEEHIQTIEFNQTVTRKRQTFFDYFPNYEQVHQWLITQNAMHPSNSQLFSVGKTSQGADIYGMKIFIDNGSPKPQVFLQGGIHAREWITVTTALYCIQELLQLPPGILNYFDFYVVPVFNVDGYTYAHTTDRMWRKNRQTNTGSTCRGVDLNRNYAFHWGEGGTSADPCSDIYKGRNPGDTAEVSAITDYLKSLNRVRFFLDIHSYGSMFMSPYGYTYNYPPTSDYDQMDRVMQVARSSIRSVNGRSYAIGTSANVIYIAAGGSDDWSYGGLGVIPSFTVEITGTGFTAPTSQILPLAREIWAGVFGVTDYLSKQQQ